MIMVGMLIAGTLNTLLTKWQNNEVGLPEFVLFGKYKGIKLQTFTHPYVQSANMFIGELLCLFVYFGKLIYARRQRTQGIVEPMSPGKSAAGLIQLRTNINPLLLAIPSSFDIIGSSLMNVALTLIPASIYQMMRGMIIIVTSVMSVIFLKKKYYRHHWSSVAIIFTGVAIVGASPLIHGS
jgi:drug/metabolite transporter (DMT)-like permease